MSAIHIQIAHSHAADEILEVAICNYTSIDAFEVGVKVSERTTSITLPSHLLNIEIFTNHDVFLSSWMADNAVLSFIRSDHL